MASSSLGTTTLTITVGMYPGTPVYDSATGNLYEPNSGSGTVSVISGGTNTVIATISVGGFPGSPAYDTANGDLYVPFGGPGSHNVSVISGANNTVFATVTVGLNPSTPAYDSSNGNLYVSNGGSSNVSVISGATNKVVKSIPVGSGPVQPAYDGATGDLYVPNQGSSNVSVISGATNTVVSTVKVGIGPSTPTYDSGNGDLYVPNLFSGNVSVISGATNALTATVVVGVDPYVATYDAANGELYVPDSGSNNVSVISGATNSVVATVAVGPYMAGGINPETPADDNATGDLYVPVGQLNSVSVIAGGNNTMTGTVSVGTSPGTPEFDFANGELYVPNTHSNTITVIIPGGLHSVQFTETGLPVTTPWDVTLNGVMNSSFSSTIGFTEPNGMYPFQVGPVTGYTSSPSTGSVNVSGAGVTKSVIFTAIPKYAVTFIETGLAFGATWSVTLNGTSNSSTGTMIGFKEPNGSDAFQVRAVAGFTASPSTGSVNVNGGTVSKSILFTMIPKYLVAFSETGIPFGRMWSVTLNGTTNSSTGSTIGFVEPNGTYAFQVGPLTGYAASPSSGSVSVNGGPASKAITFKAIPLYSVTFTGAGLALGMTWSMILNGSTNSSSGSTIGFIEPNGTFGFQVVPPAGYTTAPSSGTVTVAGAPVDQPISFHVVTYPVTFTEGGLPTGTPWSVTLGGVSVPSTTTTVAFSASNGSYPYNLGLVAGYTPSTPTGVLTVAGRPVGHHVDFTVKTYPVTFTEAGLPSGTNWTITFAGIIQNSTTPNITFPEPNGSYTYSLGSVPRYSPVEGSGSLTVNGSSLEKMIEFAADSNFGQGLLGLPGDDGLFLILAVTLVAAASVVVLIVRRRGRPPIKEAARSLTPAGGPASASPAAPAAPTPEQDWEEYGASSRPETPEWKD